MKKIHYIIALPLIFLLACGGGKKQTLEAEKEIIVAPRDSTQHSIVVYNAAKEVELGKMQKPKTGKKIVGANLIKLNLGLNNPEEKEINLDEFYNKVSYVQLKHPLTDKGLGFLGNAEIKEFIVREKGESVVTMRGFNSSVYLTENNIVAGDKYLGYHVYSKAGEFVYTLASRDKLPQYDKKTNTITSYSNEAKGEISRLTVLGNKALINVKEDTVFRTHVYDIEQQKGTMAFRYTPPVFMTFMINDNSFLAYNRSSNIKNKDYIYSTLYFEQENSLTTTVFPNYNPEATTKGRRSSSEYHVLKYYNSVLTTRQAFNDTIYRVKDANTLEAAYILNSGSLKLSNKDAHSEHKEGKLIIRDWLETDDFLFVMANIDQDFPNNRIDNKVMFRYYYYNKKTAKLYLKEGNTIYPEEYTFTCNINESIPLLATTAQQNGKKLYTSYTKAQLNKVIDSKAFASYSVEQQEKLKSLHDGLPDGGLIVAVFE